MPKNKQAQSAYNSQVSKIPNTPYEDFYLGMKMLDSTENNTFDFLKQKYTTIIESGQGVLVLSGKPGIGKSYIAETIAREQGWDYIDIRLSYFLPEDLGGMPVLEKTEKGEYTVERAFEDWIVSTLQSKEQGRKVLINFDEVDRASPEVLNAFLQIALDRRVNTFHFPENVYMIACGNFKTDNLNIDSKALLDRFIYVEHTASVDTWVSGFCVMLHTITYTDDTNKAIKVSVPMLPEIVSFIERNSEFFWKDFSEDQRMLTPRKWTMLNDVVMQTLLRSDPELKKLAYDGGTVTIADLRKISVDKRCEILQRYAQYYLHPEAYKTFRTYLESFKERMRVFENAKGVNLGSTTPDMHAPEMPSLDLDKNGPTQGQGM